jgi:choline dehydrogenase-like flavoprotein
MLMQRYNVIVIGAGSAGAAAAARISEDRRRTVLLLEAGPDYPDLESLPLDVRQGHATGADNVVGGRHDWQFTGRGTSLNEDMPVARGYVTGGTSAINGQVFLRGLPEDFDQWAALGNADWSWQKVLPYFRKLETDLNYPGGDFHGSDGPILVRRYQPDELLADQSAFVRACRDYGFPDCPDHNDPGGWGVGPLPLNNPDGIRWSTSLGYLSPARHRLNLTVRGNCLVRRILLEAADHSTGTGRAGSGVTGSVQGVAEGRSLRAVGVEVESPYYRWGGKTVPDPGVSGKGPVLPHGRQLAPDGSPAGGPSRASGTAAGFAAASGTVASRGEVFHVYADEVILCAGPIASPQLLTLSGIGPAEQVRGLGLHVLADLPGVGQNLRDHPIVHVVWKAKDGFPMPDLKVGPQKVALRYTAPGSGLRADMSTVMRWSSQTRVFLMSAVIYLAKSAGELRVASRDPHVQPSLDYRLLDHPEDMRRMKDGVRLNIRLGEHPSYRDILGGLTGPTLAEAAIDEALETWLLRNVQTMHHISGTCKMGPDSDPMAVVDQWLRVRGVEGLRVADCSIMPDCVRANTNATAIMIGERVAEFVKG